MLAERTILGVAFVLLLVQSVMTGIVADFALGRNGLVKWPGTILMTIMPEFFIAPGPGRVAPDIIPHRRSDDHYWVLINESWAYLPDADTVRFGETGYRLWGIDALQAEQLCQAGDYRPVQCGDQAREAFLKLMRSVPPSEITCTFPDQARYPNTISCYSGGQDVAEWLVRRGYAFPVGEGRYRYGEALRAAQKEKTGAWATTFLYPREWKDIRCECIAGFCRKIYEAD